MIGEREMKEKMGMTFLFDVFVFFFLSEIKKKELREEKIFFVRKRINLLEK